MSASGAPGGSADSRPVSAGGFRPYRVRVKERRRLSPHFVRLVFTGEDLDIFGSDCLDQRIKLVFPNAAGGWLDYGIDDPEAVASGLWYQRWLAAVPERRNPLRTYTVRAVDQARREVSVDFAVHGAMGPGARFALAARSGDELVIIGPDARSPQRRAGIDFQPGSARRILLAGDLLDRRVLCPIRPCWGAADPGVHRSARGRGCARW
ncbi:Siderophore-interacting FAD-binding domain-containing protein [Propionibacterium cyclohexanicum]|uniref:Siderophore-interacting FAD-binding domain-containing protein n=1 Tax=Propionibacterium cyclohexanicum TaxID=64702 RepID=A0A1H9U6G9_9ACTN|nr:siderophore-interacting protein [Propionibacterium cyclohexanicum]SES04724.1 Siderophore-interacting FAD-binding domain-containing protein [Propionibacterium cyclohexanicum]